jgi:hypothetical protein
MEHYDQVFLGVRVTEEAFLAEHSQGALNDLLDPEATQPSGVSAIEEPSPEAPQPDFEAFSLQVRGLVAEVNEKVGAAQVAADAATRSREIATARAKLDELRSLADSHPSVQLERLDEVLSLIEEIESASG